MPRVGLRIPRHVLKQVDAAAERMETSRDELYAAALAAYLRVNEHHHVPDDRSASRATWERARLPRIAVDLSDDHLRRATRLAKRLDRPRDMLMAEAVAGYVQRDRTTVRQLEFGHDAPPEVPRGRGVE